MINNKLINLFKSFSENEIKVFADFIASPYFNKRQGVLKLYKLLILYYPEFSDSNLSKEKVFSSLFPGKHYNDGTLRVLVHYLTDLAEKFITFERFAGNKPDYNFHLKEAFTERKLYKQAIGVLRESLGKFKNMDIETSERMYLNYRLHNENLMLLSYSNTGVFDKFLDNANMDVVLDDLQDFYVFKTMSIYLNILNVMVIFKKEYPTVYFDKVLSLITKEYYRDKPEIGIYYNLIKMNLEKNDVPFYRDAVKILNANKTTIHRLQLNEIYINLENYCTRKIREGKQKFLKERFRLFREELENKLYLVEGNMPTVLFRNIVLSGLELREYQWTLNFMHTYKKELQAESKENTGNYCLALYGFYTKKYDEALSYLAKIKYDELYLKIDVKILQIMLYYEMKHEESLESNLESFRHFLAKNILIPHKRKLIFQNFQRYISKIVSLKYKYDPIKKQILADKIMNDKTSINKKWLLEKLEHL